MRIDRNGSSADHGTWDIHLDEPKMAWHEGEKCVQVRDVCIRDFDTAARHDYRIYISVEEIANVMEACASGLESQTDAVMKGLRPQMSNLLRIALACAEAPQMEIE